MEFKTVLFNLMAKNNISNSSVAKATNISTARISNFVNGVNLPSLKNSIKLVNYFQCSFDYLFGLQTIYRPILENRVFDITLFILRYKELLKSHNVSNRKFCAINQINKSGLHHWKNGQEPQMQIVLKIAEALNCSIDYLLGF